MKLIQVRYFSFGSIIFSCCCIAIAFAASVTATPFSFPDWVQLSPNNSPPARSYLTMTYDPVSGKTIAFGGFDGTGYLNDTWSFDGISWTHNATQSAPPARAAAQMTYDSVAHKVVLFRRVQWNQLLGRYMALGWVDVTVDAGHASPSPSCCYRSDAISRSQWQGRCFWRIRRPLLSAYHVAMERLRLDAVKSTDCSIRSVFSGRCNEYVHRTGCYVWRPG